MITGISVRVVVGCRYNTGLDLSFDAHFVTHGWLEFLAASGANVQNGVVRDFGALQREIDATATGDVVADLSHFGLLGVAGDDAVAFLHSQVTCDVQNLPANRATYGCYCSAKGRVLANFLLWREHDGLRMLLPRGLMASVQKRLQLFVLRSKAKLTERSQDYVLIGLAGNAALGLAAELSGTPLQPALQLAHHEDITVITLNGPRVLVAVPVQRARDVWERVTRRLQPVATSCWVWLDVVSGLPWIGPATQEAFVPQMVNLELIGAVSFRKGCYPGQEVVARTQYLGATKRRLHLAHVAAERAPAEGDRLAADGDEADPAAAGIVVNAAPAPRGGYDLLAVVQTARAAGATIRLASPDGPPLGFRPLPYPVS